jgi:sporulation protein YlmC with PRC-barrel domain
VEIPINAKVECIDGVCGHSAYVLINPVIDQVTHLVVKENSSPHTEFVVPVDFVTETIAGTIRIRCSRKDLQKMDPFIKTTFIEEKVPSNYLSYGRGYGNMLSSNYYWPYTTNKNSMQIPVENCQIPPGELAIHRGTRVEATDGYIGTVDEYVINPENNHITHLVMREGHLWGKKDVIVPLSAMGEIRENTVFLRIDKHQIELLPTFPLQRHWS